MEGAIKRYVDDCFFVLKRQDITEGSVGGSGTGQEEFQESVEG